MKTYDFDSTSFFQATNQSRPPEQWMERVVVGRPQLCPAIQPARAIELASTGQFQAIWRKLWLYSTVYVMLFMTNSNVYYLM